MEIVVSTLIWAAVFQGLLLGLIFIFSKKHRSFSNKLLGLFLITFIFGAISDLIPFDFIGKYNLGFLFGTPEVKWFFPILFLHYVLEKIGRAGAFKKFLTVNYIIAFGIVSITGLNIVLFFLSGKSIYDVLNRELIESFYMVQQYCAFIITVVSFIIALIETLKFREKAKNEYTDSTMLAISWLWQFIFLMTPVIVLWGAELLRILLGGYGQSDIVLVTWGFVAILNYYVSYKAFTHQNLFDATQKVNLESDLKEPDNSKKSQKSNDKNVCEEIRIAMETNEFYLKEDLTVHDFARASNRSPRLISTCINKTFGYNFNEWVNNYRVEKALEILKEESNNHLSIEGVGSDSGFKSRSAMYIAFKKKTGKTPGHFRKI